MPACINTGMEQPFDILRQQLNSEGINPRSDESRQWFLKQMGKIAGQGYDTTKVINNPPAKEVAVPKPGMMYLFYYHPKGEEKLPYYDSFPLILLVDITKNGMTGLNLHYLPVRLRQNLFYSLLNRVSNKDMNEDTYIRMTYNFLKTNRSLKEYRPCFKRYLTNNIKGNIAQIPANEWEIAVHLPLASFEKKDESAVHRESERIMENF
jgi:hypothetical protein